MLNRDLQGTRDLVLDFRELAPTRVLASQTLTGPDLKAANTFERPDLVAPRPLETPRPGSSMTFKLPARSYSVVHLATS
jgi:alpha-L-arabinofuranosidase